MVVLHFRDLKCWQKARILSKEVYLATDSIRQFEMKDQLRRASLSIMNNIAEGFGRKGVKDKLRFYEYSTASCYETESMTYLCEDLLLIEVDKLVRIREMTVEVYKMVAALSLSIKSRSNTAR